MGAILTTATVDIEKTGSTPLQADFVRHASGALLQVCRATVRSGSVVERVTIFAGADGTWGDTIGVDALSALVRGEPAETIPALLREGTEGRAQVEVGPESESRATAIAQATAVMRASWAWDESAVITVSINGTPHFVAPQFTGSEWRATIEIGTDAI
jgi:hypothetical protein